MLMRWEPERGRSVPTVRAKLQKIKGLDPRYPSTKPQSSDTDLVKTLWESYWDEAAQRLRTEALDAAYASTGEELLTGRQTLGVPYKPVVATSEIVGAEELKQSWDLITQGVAAHADTQNSLALWLAQRHFAVRQKSAGEPNYDIAWMASDAAWVAEVKSLHFDNQDDQLRYGLGQVLEYRERLRRIGHDRVHAALVIEQPPTLTTAEAWTAVCEAVGVVLCWPPDYAPVAARLSAG